MENGGSTPVSLQQDILGQWHYGGIEGGGFLARVASLFLPTRIQFFPDGTFGSPSGKNRTATYTFVGPAQLQLDLGIGPRGTQVYNVTLSNNQLVLNGVGTPRFIKYHR